MKTLKQIRNKIRKIILNDGRKVINKFIIYNLISVHKDYGEIELYYIYNPFAQKYLWQDGTTNYKTKPIDFEKDGLIIDYPAYYVTRKEAQNMLDTYQK